ncbi:hypothetical protein EfmAA290_29140 (plasmid) [Enterococcus faecium]|nr:hypothetical protein EfmAA290_29140 [Enterococcus faecium]
MKTSKEKNISKYLLLLLGGFMILVPLVSTLFGSFKTTPDFVFLIQRLWKISEDC